jgi:hypothetical protein
MFQILREAICVEKTATCENVPKPFVLWTQVLVRRNLPKIRPESGSRVGDFHGCVSDDLEAPSSSTVNVEGMKRIALRCAFWPICLNRLCTSRQSER